MNIFLETKTEKERELEHAYREIKALKTAEALKDKALIEVSSYSNNKLTELGKRQLVSLDSFISKWLPNS